MNTTEICQQTVILFDGVCHLCNSSVSFILQHEREALCKFASMQSEIGIELLQWCGLPNDYSDAVVLIEHGKTCLGSTAALKVGQTLKFPWSTISSIGLVVPKLIRDWIYSQIGKHRYQWFGKRDACMIPTENLKSRFL